jgi:hypothetical protein
VRESSVTPINPVAPGDVLSTVQTFCPKAGKDVITRSVTKSVLKDTMVPPILLSRQVQGVFATPREI